MWSNSISFFSVHLFTANVVSMGDMKALVDLQSKTQWTIFVMLIIKASLNFNEIWFFVSVNRVFCRAVWVKCCIKMFQTCLLNKKKVEITVIVSCLSFFWVLFIWLNPFFSVHAQITFFIIISKKATMFFQIKLCFENWAMIKPSKAEIINFPNGKNELRWANLIEVERKIPAGKMLHKNGKG